MKKLFATVAFAVMVGLTSFAADIKVNQRVLAAFQKEFSTATNVSWEILKNEEKIYHASFVYANEIMEAYFSTEGEMIAAARHISQEKLPLLVAKSLRDQYGQFQFKQATEYMTAENTSYIVSIETEKASLSVRVFNTGSMEVLKKTKKS